MQMVNTRADPRTRARRSDNQDGIDFVRCRICGANRRVIAAKHLSMHGIDRQAYMEEYELSADELVATDFRQNQSSRRDYHAYSRREWIQALRAIYKQHGRLSTRYLQKNHSCMYGQSFWIFGSWDNALKAAGFKPESVRLRRFWSRTSVVKEIRKMRSDARPLNASYVSRTHRDLFAGALGKFGAWNDALGAAGIKPPKHRGRLSTLRALRDALAEHSREQIPKPISQDAALHFGSLSKALRALKSERKITSAWSRPKIITVLKRIHRSKNPTLRYSTARQNHQPLVSAAEAYFGSWRKALQALELSRVFIYAVTHAMNREHQGFAHDNR